MKNCAGFAVAVGVSLLLGGAADALAQGQGSSIPSGSRPSARPVVNSNPDSALPARVPRAVGLPGAQTDPERIAPADRPASEMRPTEALFDAINRGDIGGARDAINRGAELGGRNILGFTPVELAVDLGRRDIAFLLLSLRGSDYRPDPRGPRPNGTAAAGSAQSEAQQARAAKLEAQRAEAARRAAARVAPQQGPAVPQAQGPRLFAGDGGTPMPDAGFLGFGGGSGRSGTTR